MEISFYYSQIPILRDERLRLAHFPALAIDDSPKPHPYKSQNSTLLCFSLSLFSLFSSLPSPPPSSERSWRRWRNPNQNPDFLSLILSSNSDFFQLLSEFFVGFFYFIFILVCISSGEWSGRAPDGWGCCWARNSLRFAMSIGIWGRARRTFTASIVTSVFARIAWLCRRRRGIDITRWSRSVDISIRMLFRFKICRSLLIVRKFR